MFAGTLALLRKDMGDFAAAERGWREALAIHREVGNWRSAANVLNNLGNTLRLFKRYEEASAMLDEGLRLCDEHGFASTRPFLLINLAQVHADAGRLAAATTFAQSALEEVRRSGERKVETASNLVLGVLAVMQGDMALAARHLHDALKLARITGDVGNHLEGLDGYARWCEAQGRPDRALAVRLAILAHPQLHAELRMSIEARSQGAPPAAARIANARLDAQRTDVLALTEQALRELDSAAALLPAPAG
jgi:tetratricopeptide (TPR) repeat protein